MAHDNLLQWSFEDGLNEKRLEALGNLRGAKNEARFIRAWRPRWKNRNHHTQWVKEVVLGSFELDHQGVDALIITKLHGFEEIPIQIKSSMAGLWKHFNNYRYKKIPVIRIKDEHSDRDIRMNTIFAILQKFPQLEEKIRGVGCMVSPRVLSLLKHRQSGSKIISSERKSVTPATSMRYLAV